MTNPIFAVGERCLARAPVEWTEVVITRCDYYDNDKVEGSDGTFYCHTGFVYRHTGNAGPEYFTAEEDMRKLPDFIPATQSFKRLMANPLPKRVAARLRKLEQNKETKS